MSPWFRIHRTLHLEKIHCPIGFTVGQTFLGFAVPGFSFLAGGRRILGLCVASVYFISAILFVVGLGFPVGNVGYGLLLASHAASIAFLALRWRRDIEAVFKWVLVLTCLLGVWLLFYFPVVNFLEHHFALPLIVNGHTREIVLEGQVRLQLSTHGTVLVINPRISRDQIHRGDHIMFKLPDTAIGEAHGGQGAVWVRGGIGWGPVLALDGEHIVFSDKSFSVNGVSHPALPNMPTTGELVVPENQWFIWPEFDINRHGNVSDAIVSALILQLATVSEKQVVGKPYESWFWRKQIVQ